jgi:malonyl-CoA decarboxylase
MSSNAFFSDLLASISERGRTLLRRGGSFETKQDASGLIELCEALLSGRGEASGTAMAREVLDHYRNLDAAGRLSFFETLTRDFGPDREKLAEAIEAWRALFADERVSDATIVDRRPRKAFAQSFNLECDRAVHYSTVRVPDSNMVFLAD